MDVVWEESAKKGTVKPIDAKCGDVYADPEDNVFMCLSTGNFVDLESGEVAVGFLGHIRLRKLFSHVVVSEVTR